MSIQTPTWAAIQQVGQPLYTLLTASPVTWKNINGFTAAQGVGYGQGGFGAGGFIGTPSSRQGAAQPVWSVDDVQ